VPRGAYVLALGTFSMVTSEFVVAGLMPQMAGGLGVTIPQVGYLITVFAAAMVFGGPVLTMSLGRISPKTALTLLFAIFLAGNVLAATAQGYGVMAVARVVTGMASHAFFGVSVALAVALVRPEVRGRAVAVVMNGLMLGTLLGMPLATMIGEWAGWRAAFWAISGLTVVAALATFAWVPRTEPAGAGGLREELGVFRRPRLWATLVTSTLVIGATFAAFTYANPILTQITGFDTATIPLLLVAYGAMTVIGNWVVGRLADRHFLPTLLGGLTLSLAFLTGFALLTDLPFPAVVCLLGIGLVGVTMNPAMTIRVQRVGGTGPLLNTVHGSFIVGGVLVSSAVGGLLIDPYGLRAPLWLGAAFALLGILTLIPDLVRASGQRRLARWGHTPGTKPDRVVA
jgi:MFS transporter, DHA1 family, inner membrane transport protein